ncbi:MAG: hypothetical protein PUD02_02310 [Eggerthellales bacterium]|nr:hypothetical protein [Eggerthellales bacterium]
MSTHETRAPRTSLGRALRIAAPLAMILALTAGLTACAPQNTSEDASGQTSTSNDTVVLGDLDHYQATDSQGHSTGESLGFDEESQLQQEKTAGFSGGAVVSNLEALSVGVDGYAEREPIGIYATTGEPRQIPHGEANGTECLSCHEEGDNPIPQSHIDNNLTNEDCMDCHKSA